MRSGQAIGGKQQVIEEAEREDLPAGGDESRGAGEHGEQGSEEVFNHHRVQVCL
jgi:hypothetical protein